MTGRIMIAASSSGSGKTTVTLALLGALKARGLKLRALKCGPDYIDPMFTREVLGVPSENLDGYFSDAEQLQWILTAGDPDTDLNVIEGVMGIYDGLGGITDEASSYAVACALSCPIILVIDARGMGRTALSILRGILADDSHRLIRGVILNRISKMWYPTMKRMIEEELPIQVFGYLPIRDDIEIASRHLGLMTPQDMADVRQKLEIMRRMAEESLDLEQMIHTASQAPEINKPAASAEAKADWDKSTKKGTQPLDAARGLVGGKVTAFTDISDTLWTAAGIHAAESPAMRPRIALACDEAFCFIYEANRRILEEYGAKIIEFSPVHDSHLPADIQGLWLPGGYPELHLKELSQNQTMLEEIGSAITQGLPTIAECGGFMYLHEKVQSPEGEWYPLAGAIHAQAEKKDHLVRFGYVEVTVNGDRGKKSSADEKSGLFNGSARDSSVSKKDIGTSSLLMPGDSIRGHEFHYYDSTDNGSDCLETKPVSGRTFTAVHARGSQWMGFVHLYLGSCPAFARRFVEACRGDYL